MIEFKNAHAIVKSGQSRPEIHGNSPTPVYKYDLKLTVRVAPLRLESIFPGITDMFFVKRPLDETDLDLADKGTHEGETYLEARCPSLDCFRDKGQQLHWTYKSAGYRFTLHLGIGEKSDLNLIKLELQDIKTKFHNGGTVDLEFRLTGEPSGAEMGILDTHKQQEIEFSLYPPSAEDRAQMEIDIAKDEEEE